MRLLVVMLLALGGCEAVDDFGKFEFAGSDMDPPDLADPLDMVTPLDMTILIDLTPPPDLTPPVPRFRSDIQDDVIKLGCATAACHQAYAPLLMLTPVTDAQWMQNYNNFKVDSTTDMDLSSVLILTKNLAGNGIAHAGSNNVKPFADTKDPTYKKWLYWVQNGVPYQ